MNNPDVAGVIDLAYSASVALSAMSQSPFYDFDAERRKELADYSDAIRATVAIARRAGDGWLPIKGAPRDGKRFLGATYCPDLGAATGWRFAVMWWDDEFEATGYDDEEDHPTYRGGWTAGRVASFGMEEYHEERPSHYMPLPAPPKNGDDE